VSRGLIRIRIRQDDIGKRTADVHANQPHAASPPQVPMSTINESGVNFKNAWSKGNCPEYAEFTRRT
jgi:hypothetical protein